MRIIVVDDDPLLRAFLVRVLGAGRVDVQAVESVAQALAAITAQPPDALITDVHLGDGDGPGLVRALRGRGLDLPVVYVTGDRTFKPDDDVAAPVLQKPFTSENVAIVLANAIAAKRYAGGFKP